MGKTIMIVEDEESFHVLYDAVLEDTDHEIIHAYDGNDALARLEKKRPDLIILDMLLDLMTGDTFFLHVKGRPEYAGIPIIIVSSFPQSDYKNLKKIDPDLVYIDKSRIGEKLIPAIKARIG
jgi:CheY-like chemotaxis protein